MTAPPDVIAADDAEWCADCRQKHSKCECSVVMTPAMLSNVPNAPGTPRRTIRVPDALWTSAADKAAEKGETISDVLRRALERYVRRK